MNKSGFVITIPEQIVIPIYYDYMIGLLAGVWLTCFWVAYFYFLKDHKTEHVSQYILFFFFLFAIAPVAAVMALIEMKDRMKEKENEVTNNE